MSTNRATGLHDAVLKRVVEQVEPLTRFDRSTLKVVDGTIDSVDVQARQRFSVRFESNRAKGTGHLPPGYQRVGDGSSLSSDLQHTLQTARTELPSRLHAWLAQQSVLPGEWLAEGDCFDGPYRAGFDWRCVNCSGNGSLRCTACNGEGGTHCYGCHGNRKQKCSACNGQKHTRCDRCGGRGNVPDQNSLSGPAYPCYSCGGKGHFDCGRCFATGQTDCSMCNGKGSKECGDCRGTGSRDCQPCARTGALHESAAVTCEVDSSFSVETTGATEIARRDVARTGSLRELCELTSVTPGESRVAADSIDRRFTASVPVAGLSIEAAGERFDFVGLGLAARVDDFRNVVGALLRADLAHLEHTLTEAPTWSWKPAASLEESLTTFLQSDVNARIGTHMTDGQKGLTQFAREELHGAVSAEYAIAAAQAVGRAASRLFRAEMPRAVAVVACVPSLVIAIFQLLPLALRNYSVPSAIVLAVVAGAIVERWALARFRRRFAPAVGARAAAMVRAGRTRWWWRGAMVLAAVAVSFGAALIGYAFSR